MNPVNETLIRDVVAEVLARLNGAPAPAQSASFTAPAPCGCDGKSHAAPSNPALRGKFGVFQDANEACAAAQEAFLQLQQKGVAARRAYNEAIHRETGIENIACIVEKPTLESFDAICKHDAVRLLCVTGGPGVVKAAMQTGKRAICAGPGNPPVLVDDTACAQRAARLIIQGASYDNNLLCIGEKEVFALDNIAEKLMAEMEKNGALRLNPAQLDALTKAAFTFKEGQAGGCPHALVNRDFIGRDPSVLARAAGLNIPSGTQLLF